MNPEGVPVVEKPVSKDDKKVLFQVTRRIECDRMGTATLVTDPLRVDRSKGIFLRKPQEQMQTFLQHPTTAAMYLRTICIPFFKQHTFEECTNHFLDVSKLDPRIGADTEWLAGRLCGGTEPPPGTDVNTADESLREMLIVVHEKTPMKKIVKEYIFKNLGTDILPGAKSSTKGKKEKLQNLQDAMEQTGMHIFKWQDPLHWSKLVLDVRKMITTMDNITPTPHQVFGSWSTWGDTFEYREVSRPSQSDRSVFCCRWFAKCIRWMGRPVYLGPHTTNLHKKYPVKSIMAVRTNQSYQTDESHTSIEPVNTINPISTYCHLKVIRIINQPKNQS
jgi:hypothetical protein